MYEKTQPLMRSQFVLTYGPGSIIETENGPRLIPSLDLGLNNFSNVTEDYRISDIRMEHLINNISGVNENIRLFTLPSNASEGENDSKGLYKTLIFPAWKICYNYSEHDSCSNTAILYNSRFNYGKCPVCGKESSSHVRFVLACPSGHLDDVDWDYAVHRGKECSNNRYFKWETGRSLSSIKISCPDPNCGSYTTMQEIYNPQKTTFWCKARLPEEEPFMDFYTEHNRKVGYGKYLTNEQKAIAEGIKNYDSSKHILCKNPMKIIQRQSTALRVPLTKTLLTLPKYDTEQIDLIQEQSDEAREMLIEMYESIKEGLPFSEAFKQCGGRFLNQKVKDELEKDHNDFLKKAVDIYTHDGDYINLLNDEFNSLSDASQKNSRNFEKGTPKKFNIDIFGHDFEFTVFPINKIRTITTQIGYQRFVGKAKDGENPFKIRYIGKKPRMARGNYVWYPAFEGIGEGIFITSDSNPLEVFDLEKNITQWEKANNSLFSDISAEIYKPLLVWWHTFSHAIIRELGYMSGYSSASIRERVYATKEGKGGILLYNTSPGDETGMGGLVGSVNNFKQIAEKALSNVQNCSNDPLCSLVEITPTNINGAACINCLFLSETSCEFGNRLLDRHMLLGD